MKKSSHIFIAMGLLINLSFSQRSSEKNFALTDFDTNKHSFTYRIQIDYQIKELVAYKDGQFAATPAYSV